MHFTTMLRIELIICLSNKPLKIYVIVLLFAVAISENVQNMKHVQNCACFIFCAFNTGVHLEIFTQCQRCRNTMPDLSDLVPYHSGQVENFYLLVLGQVKMY